MSSFIKFDDAIKTKRRVTRVTKVILNLEIDGQGTLIKSSIKQSSDFKILDEEAINMVKRASPFPKPSKELESVIFNVIVPITFRLTKAESNLDWLF